MTVSSSTSRIEYAGNGLTAVFAYNFRILDDDHIEVILVSPAGVETVQTKTTHYTVSGVGDAGGGNITMVTAPASGESLVLRRNMPFTQETDYTSGDPFPAETHENALDERNMESQQNKEEVERAVRAPKQDGVIGYLPFATSRANKILSFDASGNPTTTLTTSDIQNALNEYVSGVAPTEPWDEFSGTPTQTSATTFTLTGDQTSTFASGTRLKFDDVGTLYGIVTASAYTSLTTVTVTLDSGSLTGSLTKVYTSIAATTEKPITADAVTSNTRLTSSAINRSIHDFITDLAINVKDFGATGDGVTDDTAAIQAAVDYAATLGDSASTTPWRRSGGTIYFPNGTYRTTSEITFNSGVYVLRGTGRFKTYSQVFEPLPDCLSTIMPVHADRNCFTINPGAEEISVRMFDLNIATLETGSVPTAAIGFRVGTEFNRDYTFERVAITGFTSAFDVYNAGGATGIATLKIDDCSITRNSNILRCLDGQVINQLIFTRNEAGQNTSGMNFIGHSFTVESNVMEGQDDVILVNGSYRGGSIRNNYFETIGGDFCIYLNTVKGATIGPNFYNNISSDVPLLLRHGRDNACNEVDVVPCCDGGFDPFLKQNLIAPIPSSASFNQNGASVAFLWDEKFRKSIESFGVEEIGGYETTNPTGYHKNIAGSVGSAYTTTGSGLIQYTKGSLSEADGTWLGVAILATYDDDVDVFPRLELRVNSTTSQGYHDGQFEEWENSSAAGTDRLKDKTVLYVAYVQAEAAVTSFQLNFYPYGLNPAAGKRVVYSQPMMIKGLQDGAFTPFIASQYIEEATTSPSSGTWPLGWTFKNRNPLATEYFGWTCVSAGTPGTWKGYGVVQT